MTAITLLSTVTGQRAACRHLAMARSTYYHRRRPRMAAPCVRVRPSPPRTLSTGERQVTERHRPVIDDLGHLKRAQSPVAAVLPQC